MPKGIKPMLTPAKLNRIMADMKPLGELLRDWRELMHLTPAEAARVCGLSAQHYWQLENGERGAGVRTVTLHKLAAGTGIPLERLAAAVYMTASSVTPPRQLATA